MSVLDLRRALVDAEPTNVGLPLEEVPESTADHVLVTDEPVADPLPPLEPLRAAPRWPRSFALLLAAATGVIGVAAGWCAHDLVAAIQPLLHRL